MEICKRDLSMNKWIHLIHNKLINIQGWRVTKLPRWASRTSQAVGRPPVCWGTPVSPSQWTPGKGSRRRDLSRSHRVEPHNASLLWQLLSDSTGEASSTQSVSLHRLGFPICFVILEIAIKYLNCTESAKEITSALLQLPSLLWFLSLKYFYLHGNKFFKVKLVFCVCVCVCEVAQLCLTLCDPMVYSLPGSSVHGILQARVLDWVAISFSRGSSRPMDQAQVSCLASRRFTVWATREGPLFYTVIRWHVF